jgi:hypothetical protein
MLARHCTFTVPFIPACRVHVYEYPPAVGNVRDTVPVLVFPMSPPVGLFAPKVTLCSDAKVQVTVPPGAIVTVDGLNVLLVVAVTSAVEGFGPACMTVTVTPSDWTPPEVARMDDEPAATPVAVVDTPELVDVPVAGDTVTFVWSELDHVTVRPDSVLPCASRGSAVKPTVALTLIDWPAVGCIATVDTVAGGGGVPPPPPPPPPQAARTANTPTRRNPCITGSSRIAVETVGLDPLKNLAAASSTGRRPPSNKADKPARSS